MEHHGKPRPWGEALCCRGGAALAQLLLVPSIFMQHRLLGFRVLLLQAACSLPLPRRLRVLPQLPSRLVTETGRLQLVAEREKPLRKELLLQWKLFFLPERHMA